MLLMVRCYYESVSPYKGRHTMTFHHTEATPAGTDVEVWKCQCGQLTWNWASTANP